MAHTRGPWKYVPDEFNTERQDSQPGSICSAADWYVAVVEFVHSEKETLANAQLLAAAPDLLEACESALAHLAQSKEFDRLSPEDQLQAEVSLNRKLQAAVKKAKGEASNG